MHPSFKSFLQRSKKRGRKSPSPQQPGDGMNSLEGQVGPRYRRPIRDRPSPPGSYARPGEFLPGLGHRDADIVGMTGDLLLVRLRDDQPRLGLRPYIYTQLHQARSIRLLRFGNASPHSSWTLELHEFSLDDACPDFQALSYTWGHPLYRREQQNVAEDVVSIREVECAGRACDVTENLLDALERLRFVVGKGYIWVDALCIDQKNQEEKALQVAMLGDIYRAARRVLVWLGASTQWLPDFAALRKRVEDAEERFRNSPDVFGDKPLSQRNPLDATFVRAFWGEPPEFLDTWTEYFNFFRKRRYFRRAWIVQEIALARDFVFLCGDQEIRWQDVQAVGSFMRRSGWRHALAAFADPEPAIEGIGDEADNLLEYRRQVISGTLDDARFQSLFDYVDGAQTPLQRWLSFLGYLIQEGRRFSCSEKRDHIYSFMGLAGQFRPDQLDETLMATLQPDYKEDWFRLFTGVAGVLVRHTPILSLLSLIETRQLGFTSLPSWVPDFSVPLGRVPLIHRVDGDIFNAFPASPDTLQKRFICGDPGQPSRMGLRLRGVCVGKVQKASLFSKVHKSHPDVIQCLGMAVQARDNGTDWNALEMLWRTLIADVTDAKPRQHPAPDAYGTYFATWLAARLARDIASSENIGANLEKVQGFLTTMFKSRTSPRWDSLGRLDNHFEKIASDTSSDSTGRNEPAAQQFGFNDAEVVRLEATEDYYLYNRSVSAACRDARFFITNDGRLGVGRSNISLGDEIWLLEGARVPFVLTKSSAYDEAPGEPESYWLVGEAYVHGIMHGELTSSEKFAGRVETVQIV